MRVFTVNPGSTSLKLALVEDAVRRESESADGADDLTSWTERWAPVDAAAVRFVHGGPDHLQAIRLDADVLAELDAVADLAPLHNPPASAAARTLLSATPDRPVVACFDTSFFADLPAAAATYALPREWNDRWRLRRYGFHGLSHEHAVRKAAELAGRSPDPLRVVTCHLGGGASLAAVVDGRPVDTTMGFTPLEGLVMVTRSGSVDPGLLLWLLRQNGIDPDTLEETLDRRSGLAGLAGHDGEFRTISERAQNGDPDARLGIDVYLHRLVREVGAMVASAGGIDVLVLTGGVGEHSDLVRRTLEQSFTYLQTSGPPVRVLTIPAREELVMAEQTQRVTSTSG